MTPDEIRIDEEFVRRIVSDALDARFDERFRVGMRAAFEPMILRMVQEEVKSVLDREDENDGGKITLRVVSPGSPADALGPKPTCEEFSKWCKENGFHHWDGDAEELLGELCSPKYANTTEHREQIRWLGDFVKRWEELYPACRNFQPTDTRPVEGPYELRDLMIHGPGIDQPCDVSDLKYEERIRWVGLLTAAFEAGMRSGINTIAEGRAR